MNRAFTTYYAERKPERRRELDLCLAINSTVFDRLCVMSENVQGPGALNAEWKVVNQRQTYAGVLAWIGEAAAPDDLSVITNCDIVIPPDALRLIEQHIGEREMYALSRYEAGHGGKLDLYDAEYSQDVWAFRGKPPTINRANPFGVPGCENNFAAEVAAADGWRVSNPSRSIRTIHLHSSRVRTPTNSTAHRLPPPYLFIPPTRLGEPVETKLYTDLAAFAHRRRPERLQPVR
jgi:hypothetical protein